MKCDHNAPTDQSAFGNKPILRWWKKKRLSSVYCAVECAQKGVFLSCSCCLRARLHFCARAWMQNQFFRRMPFFPGSSHSRTSCMQRSSDASLHSNALSLFSLSLWQKNLRINILDRSWFWHRFYRLHRGQTLSSLSLLLVLHAWFGSLSSVCRCTQRTHSARIRIDKRTNEIHVCVCVCVRVWERRERE